MPQADDAGASAAPASGATAAPASGGAAGPSGEGTVELAIQWGKQKISIHADPEETVQVRCS